MSTNFKERLLLEFDASDMFEDEAGEHDLRYCEKNGVVIRAGVLLPCVETREASRLMKKAGCSREFIQVYRDACEFGAYWLLVTY